jgi:hypothetical protein
MGNNLALVSPSVCSESAGPGAEIALYPQDTYIDGPRSFVARLAKARQPPSQSGLSECRADW